MPSVQKIFKVVGLTGAVQDQTLACGSAEANIPVSWLGGPICLSPQPLGEGMIRRQGVILKRAREVEVLIGDLRPSKRRAMEAPLACEFRLSTPDGKAPEVLTEEKLIATGSQKPERREPVFDTTRLFPYDLRLVAKHRARQAKLERKRLRHERRVRAAWLQQCLAQAQSRLLAVQTSMGARPGLLDAVARLAPAPPTLDTDTFNRFVLEEASNASLRRSNAIAIRPPKRKLGDDY